MVLTFRTDVGVSGAFSIYSTKASPENNGKFHRLLRLARHSAQPALARTRKLLRHKDDPRQGWASRQTDRDNETNSREPSVAAFPYQAVSVSTRRSSGHSRNSAAAGLAVRRKLLRKRTRAWRCGWGWGSPDNEGPIGSSRMNSSGKVCG